jgi:hypothetical protein
MVLLYDAENEPVWQPMTLPEAEIFCSGLTQAPFTLEEAELIWELLHSYGTGEGVNLVGPVDQAMARELANKLAPMAGRPTLGPEHS